MKKRLYREIREQMAKESEPKEVKKEVKDTKKKKDK